MTALWPYVARPSLYRLPGDRIPAWTCRCANRQPWQRHREPWACIPDVDVEAWRAQHPEVTASFPTARRLMWLEREFAPPPGRAT